MSDPQTTAPSTCPTCGGLGVIFDPDDTEARSCLCPDCCFDWAEAFMDGYIVGTERRPATVPSEFFGARKDWLAGWDAGDIERRRMKIDGGAETQ